MSELPSTWLETTLSAVVPYGTTVKAEPGDITPETWVLELEDIEKDTTKVLQRLSFADRQSKSAKNRFDAGDVLYGKLRPYLNKVIFADQPGVCTTEIVPIKPTDALNGRYLFHWLRHPRFLAYVTEVSHGVNMPRLGTEAGRQAPLVLAPKNEQKRIADKLDPVLARVDAVNTRLARVVPILKRFRQSVLAAATSGRLTEDWRLRERLTAKSKQTLPYGEIPGHWMIQPLDALKSPEKYSLAIGPFGSDLTTKDYRDSGVPLVFVREIRSRSFSDGRTKYVSTEKAFELSAHSVSGGDVLITKMGAPPGDVAIYPSDAPDAVITADCIKLRVNQAVALSSFVAYALESPAFRTVLLTAVAGVAQQKVSLARFRVLPVAVPCLSEQVEIVRRVEALFAFANRLEARLQTAQTAAERLTPALLAKAFRGEMVPQDPNDEPASELLRRLQADVPGSKSTRSKRAAA